MSTEIFATFGPSCRDGETLKNMVRAGVTGMRLNLSHMTLPEAKDYIDNYRSVTDSPQILIDMQGPELRIGKADIELRGSVTFGREGIEVPDAVLEALSAGDEVLLDDGRYLCRMTDNTHGEVIRGGFLPSRKSIKVKDKYIPMSVLTEHDIANVKLARSYGVTAVMQPFVQCGVDLKRVRQVLDSNGAENIKIYAKIENKRGADNLRDILPCADVIVIARGDLGNDMPLWELPRVQKEIEALCHEYQKPYIVVTQMLASMEHAPVPTRAEVSDIFHAVYHGAWGVMITGETAIGDHPAEAVKYLAETAKTAVRYRG